MLCVYAYAYCIVYSIYRDDFCVINFAYSYNTGVYFHVFLQVLFFACSFFMVCLIPQRCGILKSDWSEESGFIFNNSSSDNNLIHLKN